MPLLFGDITRNKLSLHQFVELMSYHPTRLYSLYPRKDTVAMGTNTDITLRDPGCYVHTTNDVLYRTVDYTPYEGIEVAGWPVRCFSCGEMPVENGKYLKPTPGRGQFLPAGILSLV